MILKGKLVLVTGADGFIGSHLVEALIKREMRVRALVLYNSFGSNGWLDSLSSHIQRSIEIVPGDIRDSHRTRVLTKGIDVVFHLASLIAIPYSFLAPESYVATNVNGTLNVLQASLDEKVQSFIHISTSEVYGSAQYTPMDELHPLSAQSPYAATKIAADQLALSFQRTFGLNVAVVRPFNTFGPRQSVRAVIPTIITQIQSGRTEIELGSLTPIRDFTFVTDTVEGIIKAAETDSARGEVTNLGTGTEISVGDIVNRIAMLSGRNVSVTSHDRRVRPAKSEVDRLLSNNQKAATLLNWRPMVSLDEGLKQTIAWFSKTENLARFRHNEYGI